MADNNEAAEEQRGLLGFQDDSGADKDSNSKFSRLAALNILLVLVNLLVVISGVCLLAPFFPAEAKRKGLSIEETSMVFTCYQVTVFIVSLACGLLVSVIYSIISQLSSCINTDCTNPQCWVLCIGVSTANISAGKVHAGKDYGDRWRYCLRYLLLATRVGLSAFLTWDTDLHSSEVNVILGCCITLREKCSSSCVPWYACWKVAEQPCSRFPLPA